MLIGLLALALLTVGSAVTGTGAQQITETESTTTATSEPVPLVPFVNLPDNTAASVTDRPSTTPETTTFFDTDSSSPSGRLENDHRRRNDTDGHQVVTVAVIGSGIAGITAARHLTDKTNFDVVVLEANTERYGGRLWSYEVPGYRDKPVDLGAMWIHGGMDPDHPLNKFITQYGIGTIEHDVGESNEIDIYDLWGKKYNHENMEEIAKVPHLIEQLRKEIIDSNSSDISYLTAFDMLKKRYPKLMEQSRVRLFELPGLESYQGSTRDQISLIYADGIPNSTTVVDYEGHDVIVPSGYRHLLDVLITTGRPFKIELGRLVEEIKYSDSTVTLTAVDPKSKEKHIYNVDHVVVTVPLGVLKKDSIRFIPRLPMDKLNAIERIGFGNFVKVLLVFDQVFWPETKFFGTESVNPTGLPLFYINMHKIHKLPALLASISSEGAVAADKMTESELIGKMLEHLEAIFGQKVVQERKLIHTKVTRWRNDPLIGGAYSFGKLNMKSEDAYNIRTPIKPYLFFAGEHTTFPENVHGTAHGAYISGIRAAQEVMVERGVPLTSSANTVNWLGKIKRAAILSHLIVLTLLII